MWVTNIYWWFRQKDTDIYVNKMWRSSSHSKLIYIYSSFISTPRKGPVPWTCKDLYELDLLNKLTHTWAFAFSPVLVVNILLDNRHELKKLLNFNGELRAICCNRKAHYPCFLVCAAVKCAVATDGWQLKFLELCTELERLLDCSWIEHTNCTLLLVTK